MPDQSASYKPVALPDYNHVAPEDALRVAQEYLALLKTRHSIRMFARTDVDQSIIETAIAAAGRAPSGANQQPWHFVAIKNQEMKKRVREAAEIEEQAFYDGGGGDEWIRALEPIGTDPNKPHLTDAPWLIIVFAQRYGLKQDGERYKHYYVPESVGIATGFLVTALHQCGLSCLIHTPSPMTFLNEMCQRPTNEKPMMIIPVGYPADKATVPETALKKKSLNQILSVF